MPDVSTILLPQMPPLRAYAGMHRHCRSRNVRWARLDPSLRSNPWVPYSGLDPSPGHSQLGSLGTTLREHLSLLAIKSSHATGSHLFNFLLAQGRRKFELEHPEQAPDQVVGHLHDPRINVCRAEGDAPLVSRCSGRIPTC